MSDKPHHHQQRSLLTVFILLITFFISQISTTSICCPAATSDDRNPLLYSRSPVAECHPFSSDENKMWDFAKRDRKNDFESVGKRGEAKLFEKREKLGQEKKSFEERDNCHEERLDERCNGYIPNGCHQPVCCEKRPPIAYGGAPGCNNAPFVYDSGYCGGCGTEYDVGRISICNPIRPGLVPLGWSRF
ncbi:17180_t:CDS:1 [Acaulospora morrowiae]|uniref:17180_t:CDS:1 n=1 Tax=Acaulospora morrowiae TaxID=94023 RepID=A0A9N9EJJ9_9GLOM|nr:17180_t:CDS:1 [Acaulospora morrowiae]